MALKRRIDRLAKKYLPEWIRLPVRYARLRLNLTVQGFIELFQRGRFNGLPLPPPLLRYRVQGAVVDPAGFLNTGLNCAQNIRSALGRVGMKVEDFREVLSFGCGCGRILRWFNDLNRSTKVRGTDMDKRAVNWCRRHLPFAEFDLSDPEPPTKYRDDRFDLILCLSVVGHLDRPFQERWLKELKRVLKPGGFLLASFFGRAARNSLKEEDQERVESEGFLFLEPVKGFFKLDGLPDFYQVAFQTREDVLELCAPLFKVRDYLEGGLGNYEDLVILEKADPGDAGPSTYAKEEDKSEEADQGNGEGMDAALAEAGPGSLDTKIKDPAPQDPS